MRNLSLYHLRLPLLDRMSGKVAAVKCLLLLDSLCTVQDLIVGR